jgi:hypothetical protein
MTAPAAPEPEIAPVQDVGMPQRRVRVPFGTKQQRLDNTPIPGFQCYWVNDIPGRVERAKRAGYEHVTDEDGSPVKEVVGVSPTGGPLHAYRMKLPIEFYQEDMEAKEKPRAQVDEEMRKAIKNDGGYAAQGRPAYAASSSGNPNHLPPAVANLDPITGRQTFRQPAQASQPTE